MISILVHQAMFLTTNGKKDLRSSQMHDSGADEIRRFCQLTEVLDKPAMSKAEYMGETYRVTEKSSAK